MNYVTLTGHAIHPSNRDGGVGTGMSEPCDAWFHAYFAYLVYMRAAGNSEIRQKDKPLKEDIKQR